MRSRYFTLKQFDVSDDCVENVLERVDDDYSVVGLMRVSVQFARMGAAVLTSRHQLEAEQLVAYVAALRGKNVLVSGGGGCGKSHVARLVVQAARSRMRHESVAVCAPTGLAAGNVGGVTIDSLIGSRRAKCVDYPTTMPWQTDSDKPPESDEEENDSHSNLTLSKTEIFAPIVSSRVGKVIDGLNLLVVDELSMVSSAKLDLMFAVLDYYRNKRKLQVVFMADFCQLPPVIPPNSVEHRHVRATDCGVFAFEASVWKKLDVLEVELKVNKRCANPEWNALLSRIRMGQSPRDFPDLRANLRRMTAQPITRQEAAQEKHLAIFGRNNDVHAYNNLAYLNMAGSRAEVIVDADDSPTSWGAVPRQFPAFVGLKPQEPVMITVALHPSMGVHSTNRTIYSGTMATVVSDEHGFIKEASLDGGVLLNVDGHGEVNVRGVESVREFKRAGNKEKGYRIQLPLQLAAACSVHKSQGRTISRKLLVDLNTMWNLSGMAYVALSRTTDPSLMSVHGISSAVAHVDPRVVEFTARMCATPLPFWARA